MQTCIILSRFAAGTFEAPMAFKKISAGLAEKPGRECPGVQWKTSFATPGRYDVVDIVEADDPVEMHRAVVLINSEAHATTETTLATPRRGYLAGL